MAASTGRVGSTSTSSFGVGRRESHDASEFYARFAPPELTLDDTIAPRPELPQGEAACIEADARHLVLPDLTRLPDNCVALVVTSPPYFSGKEYEQALGEGHVPGDYLEYLQMLRDVFAECSRVLEPGGRIAVNVANLGRRPYRSLSSDVIRILQDDLGLLLRGEVIWRKGEAASGSCAWGSFRSAANPVLRDVTERVVVASKGRFDRARTVQQRRRLGLPHETEIAPDEFVEATLDVWSIAPESAKRVNHPAPFPVELPQRLIGLYTFRDDLVLDPFMGSGTTLVAALRSGRRYLGYDTDPSYVARAKRRLKEELRGPLRVVGSGQRDGHLRLGGNAGRGRRGADAGEADGRRDTDLQARAARAGKMARGIAESLLVEAGFTVARRDARVPGIGMALSFVALDAGQAPWSFDLAGAFTTTGSGLLRTESVFRAIGRASVLARGGRSPVVILTSHRPRPGSEGDRALRAVGPTVVFDVVELLSEDGPRRLAHYARSGPSARPLAGFWTERELARR
jgi:site-specific DNA-methyltransferase (adenine-specific)